MNNFPLVSVIIPTFNSGRFIVQAVESVLQQTYSLVEVIVVDDGSSDGTREILGPFRDKIRYIDQENRGISCARNAGIREARGELIAFLDADDWWLPKKLEQQVPHLLNSSKVGLVHCGVQGFDQSSGEPVSIGSRRAEYVGHCYRQMIFANGVLPSSVIIHRGTLTEVGLFDEGFSNGCVGAEDHDLFLRLARQYEFAFEPEPLVIYRVYSASISHQGLSMARANLRVLENAIQADPCLGDLVGRKQLRRQRFERHFSLGYTYFESGNLALARASFWNAFRLRPFHFHVAGLLGASFLPKILVLNLRKLKQDLTNSHANSCNGRSGVHRQSCGAAVSEPRA